MRSTLSLVSLLALPALAQTCPPIITTDGIAGVRGVINDMEYFDLDGPGPQAPVLVVAGTFGAAGGVVSRSIAAWNGLQWIDVSQGLTGSPQLQSIAVHQGELFASGQAGASASPNLFVRWNGQAWVDVPRPSTTNPIRQLTSFQNELCFIRGTLLEAWNGQTYRTLATLGTSSVAPSLLQTDGTLFVAGGFTSINGQAIASRVARLDGESWSAVGGLSQNVTSLTWFNNALFAAGTFTLPGGNSAAATFDGTSWNRFGPTSNTATGLFVQAQGDSLWLEATISPFSSRRLFKLDSSQSVEREYRLRVTSAPGSMVTGVNNSPLGSFVSGHFNEFQLVTDTWRSPVKVGVARIEQDGAVRRVSMAPSAFGQRSLNGSSPWIFFPKIHRLRNVGSALIAAGQFANETTGATASEFTSVASFNGQTWTGLGSNLFCMGDAGSPCVGDAIMHNDSLYATGSFSLSGTSERNIARWNGTAWEPVGGGIGPDLLFSGRTLASFEGRLIVGGKFTQAGSLTTSNIAAWDGASWQPLGTGLPDAVEDLVVFQGSLHASGRIDAQGTPRRGVTRWNGTDWEPLGEGLQFPGVQNFEDTWWMQVHGNHLYIAGKFNSAGNVSGTSRIARWNGSSWSGLNLIGAPTNIVGDFTSFGEHQGDLLIMPDGPNGASNTYRYNDVDGWRVLEGVGTLGPPYIARYMSDVESFGDSIFLAGSTSPFILNPGPTESPFLQRLQFACGPICDSIDFNNDGTLFDSTDVDAFFSVFSEGPCIPATATCNDIDFNNDGSTFDPQDIDSFLSVFSEGPCL